MTAVYRSMADYCQSISGYATARALEKAADEIESLRAERDQLRARVAELHDSLTERDFVIEGLNAKHDARVQAIHDLYADQLYKTDNLYACPIFFLFDLQTNHPQLFLLIHQ